MDPRSAILAVDIGNTRTKTGVFVDGRLLRYEVLTDRAGEDLCALAADIRPAHIALASVAEPDAQLLARLRSTAPLLVVNGSTPGPLRNGYTSPSSLGADRWANAAALATLFPQRPALAIALGTCVTYDAVDASGTYVGGLISPGFRMRVQAMHHFTARLPLVDVPERPALPGTTTAESLAAGTHHGLLAELRGLIAHFRQQHPGLAVAFTGGDALRFSRALENGIFAHPFLTLYGLHVLALHNAPHLRAAAAGS